MRQSSRWLASSPVWHASASVAVGLPDLSRGVRSERQRVLPGSTAEHGDGHDHQQDDDGTGATADGLSAQPAEAPEAAEPAAAPPPAPRRSWTCPVSSDASRRKRTPRV